MSCVEKMINKEEVLQEKKKKKKDHALKTPNQVEIGILNKVI